MTECIPNSYSSFPCKTKQHFRRSSITQATISSIAKDVRSKDDVSSLLRRKESTPNKSIQPKRPLTRQSAHDSRARGATDKQSVSNLKSASPSVKLRLDGRKSTRYAVVEDDFLYMQKKYPKREKTCGRGLTSAYGSSDSLSSISSSCSSSSSTSCIQGKHSETNHHSWPFAQPPPLSSKIPIHQLRETVLEDLASTASSYSREIQDLSNAISVSFSYNSIETLAFQRANRVYRDSVTPKSQIQECKALLVQQQELLNKLEELVQEGAKEAPEPIHLPESKKNNSSRLIQRMKDKVMSPTGITELVIRQNKMNKKDTIVSIQGVCETTEASLVPYKLEEKNVYYFQFKLDINQYDRRHKFTLLPSTRWQKDNQIHQCQFKSCCTQFGLLQRKHHCRRCGNIYCSSHSQNRLPLFTFEDPEKTNFSRVCDSCFFELSSKHLSLYN